MAMAVSRIAGPTQPGTGATTLYTNSATAGTFTIIKEIWVANTTGSAATITIGVNGTAAANQILPAISVPANTAFPIPCSTVLGPSDTLQALQGTASAITATVSGVTGP